ncbi:penicillin-binding protein activator [Halomonas urumqiensis]|uniref:LppC family lipoprotein n=1 Tax=Halomonas urumqiensis TaxID=1684789 RepID=A0A2N7UGG3_9GAMM|nr:penicillin-binding protein activator [Halomonas urumqiensis]PMR79493.1 LppC family lipoprotein [Halomonas urumqiensis]PTB01384.1 LppC family lipoprotein [Halomonas urumqiensis]GHE22529.1 penicillin-binding protein activator [Halomonas urumqiensis]
MLTPPRGLLATALVTILLAGCAYQPGIVERMADDDPASLLEQAQQQDPEQAAQTRLEAAEILARQGNATQALDVASTIDDARLPPQARARWALLLAELGDSLDDPSAVIQAGQNIDELDLSADRRLALREQLGMALLDIGEPAAAAQALLRVQADTDDESLNDAIWEAIEQLEGGALSDLGRDGDSLTLGWVRLAELVRSGGGDIERLFARLDDWRERNARHPAARSVPAELLALRELRGTEVSHMAVLLPESGPLAGAARAIREGMRMHHQNAINGGGSGTRLSFIDSSQGSLDALYQEARNRGAQVVIGPLDKDQVTELETGDSVPLPTLALNYGNSESNQARRLYQYGLSAEDEARQVAQRAWVDGHRSAGLLVPDNDWGRRVGEAFWDEWRARGGEVSNAVRYNPNAAATESTRRAITNPQPDMLFLLALPEYARQVPPTMDYYYAGELPVYATSHLFEGRLNPQRDHDLDDVQFVDIPWQIPDAAVGGEDALPFTASYRQLREESDPGMFRLMAMGVDAYELGRRLPQFQAMSGSEMFGATGTLRAGQDGRIQRQLPWARFVNGVPQPILIPGIFGDERAE